MTTSRRPYRSDLSDARWALIEPVLSAWRVEQTARGLGINEAKHDLREIVNAILYVNRTGIGWPYLPHDFPPHQSVYVYFCAWARDGTAEKIHEMLRRRVRQMAGRQAEPTAALIDAQSIRTSSNVPESSQGADNAKKIVGRKRHIATDTLGLLLVILITAASVQDTTGGRDVIDALANGHPSVVKTWVDAGYKSSVIARGAAHGIDVEVVTKIPGQGGFVPQPKRWAVERTFGWLMQHRRLVRDYETHPEHSRSMIHWAMIDNMSRRITRETTQTWHEPTPETLRTA